MNMDVSKKTYGSNNQEKKRVSIKSGGGVGIGAVVMFGGALATAALASAFVFKRRGLSSAEIKKQSEKEEEMRTVSVDDETDTSLHAQKHQSEDVKENFETFDDSQSLSSQDELPGIETSVGILDAADSKNDEILRLSETDVISDDSMVKNELQLDEKLSIDLNVSMEEAKVQLQDEDSPATVLNSNGNDDAELVTVDEDKGGEVSEANNEFDAEIKDMQATEEEDEDGDAVVIKEMQVIADDSKPKVNSGKEESGEVVHIDTTEAHNAEETGLEVEEDDDQKHIQTPDNKDFQVPELEEEEDEKAEEFLSPGDIQDKGCDLDSVSPGDIQDKGCDIENRYQIYVEKTIKDDDGIGGKGEDIINYEEDDETDSSEPHSSEQSVDSSKESNSEAIWPTEDLHELTSTEPQKFFSEIEGKILEDKAGKERELHESKAEDVHFKADKQRFENNNLVQKETTKDLKMSSTKRRLVIAILLTLSSISVSLIFDMSLTKLCFISFLTMLLSEMNAYRTI